MTTPTIIEMIIEEILKSEPMEWYASIERTAQTTGRAPQYGGKLIQDVLKTALTRVRESTLDEVREKIKERGHQQDDDTIWCNMDDLIASLNQ